VEGGLQIGTVQAATPTTSRTRQRVMFALFQSLKVGLVEDNPLGITVDPGGARELGRIDELGTGTAPSAQHIISLQKQLASSAIYRSLKVLELIGSRAEVVEGGEEGEQGEQEDDDDELRLSTDQGTGRAAIATLTILGGMSNALSAIVQRMHRTSKTF